MNNTKECKVWREWGQGKERKTLYKFSYFQLIFPHWNNEHKGVSATTQAKFGETFKTTVLSMRTILCTHQAAPKESLIHAYSPTSKWKLVYRVKGNKNLGKKPNPLASWRLLPLLISEEPKAVREGWCCARTPGRQKDSPDLFLQHEPTAVLPSGDGQGKQHPSAVTAFSSRFGAKCPSTLNFSVLFHAGVLFSTLAPAMPQLSLRAPRNLTPYVNSFL